ncbi:hypothetical protein ACLKA6_013612 [Drosophila palustris]
MYSGFASIITRCGEACCRSWNVTRCDNDEQDDGNVAAAMYKIFTIAIFSVSVSVQKSMMRSHLRTTKGFCLCHLLCVWQVAGKLCLYLGYFNASYVPQTSQFVLDDQLYVQLMALANFILSVAYLWLSQRWIYDQLLLLLYLPLYVYFLQLRQHLTRLLNDCAQVHGTLQHVLGAWLCVSLRKGTVLTLLLPLELILLLVWQCHKYYSYQFCFIAGIAFIYHMQLVFLGNYFIWLGSIYRALNAFLAQHMRSSKLGILRTILKQEAFLYRIHCRIIHYFALHLLSFVALIVATICQLFVSRIVNNELHIERLQLVHLMLLLSLLFTILMTAHELQLQRGNFHNSFLLLEDRLEFFQLKSWCLLKNQTLPMPFGLPILRSFVRPERKRDIITMLASIFHQFCLRLRVLPLVSLGLGSHQLQLSLPQLFKFIIQLCCMTLLPLCLHSQLQINFYNCLNPSDFDANVTSTISQVYRWYTYDELELHFDGSKQSYGPRVGCWYKDYLPGTIILLIICVHFYFLLEMEYIYGELRELEPESLPPIDVMDLLSELCHDVMFLLLLVVCLVKRNQLYRAVNLAQMCYKQLSELEMDLRCSTNLFLLGISQLLLLFVCCLKLFWFDLPLKMLDVYNICDYLMGAVRFLFVLLLSLHFFYHLLHASLLQSLNLQLQQQKSLKLWHQLIRLQSLLHKLQHSVACYFGVSFCGFYALLCLRCAIFLGVFSYDEQRFVPHQSEMEPLEMPLPPTRGDLLRTESFHLAWQVALMWLLLRAALVQQREHNKLLIGIWRLSELPTEDSLATKDILSYVRTFKCRFKCDGDGDGDGDAILPVDSSAILSPSARRIV